MHTKRQTISKSWPIPRKGTKYVAVATHENKNGIPLMIVLRDILKVAKTRKEVKAILNQGLVFINDKTRKEENFSVLPFDALKIGNKSYELVFSEKGKLQLKEAAKKETILKVVGKKILRGEKVQLNLLYGKNILTEQEAKVGDSVILKEKKVEKILHLEKNREAIVLSGQYRGKEGNIEKIDRKIVVLSCKNKKINIPVKNIMVIK